MKLKVIEFDGSSHRKVVTEAGKEVCLFYKDVDGHYYFEPLGTGVFTAVNLVEIAELLNEINAPFDKQTKEFFKKERSSKVGRKVFIKKTGHQYTAYWDMFIELGFKNPDKSRQLRDYYPQKSDYKDVEFTIFNIGKHKVEGIKLYAVRDENGNEFLFSRKGLKFKQEEDFIVDEFTGVVYPKTN